MNRKKKKLIEEVEKIRLSIPKDFVLRKKMVTWQNYFGQLDKCLFLGKGPSLDFLDNYKDYAHIATVNESCLKAPHVDFGFFFDHNTLMRSKKAWGKIKTFVLPAMVFGDIVNGSIEKPIRIDNIQGLPLDRVIVVYENQHSWEKEEIRNSISCKKLINTDTSVMGLHFLVKSGFRNIFLLGHDGKKGYAKDMPCIAKDRDMQKYRDIIEFVSQELTSIHIDLRIEFFDGTYFPSI